MLQVCQRADDVRKSLDLLQLLNDGAKICNMMEGYFDFQQFQVCMYQTHFLFPCMGGERVVEMGNVCCKCIILCIDSRAE